MLLLGVTHGENTTLHLAESMARVPYSVAHPCVVVGEDGAPRTVMIEETDHCCRNFARAGEWLTERGLQRVGEVGEDAAILCGARRGDSGDGTPRRRSAHLPVRPWPAVR